MTLLAATPAARLNADDVAGAAGEAAARTAALLEALPVGAHVTMGVALVAGLVLWLYGARLIRPIFSVLGLAAGALVGVVLPPSLGIDEVGGIEAWVLGLGLGAVVGLIVATVLLKIAITFTAGLAFAVAGFLGALVYIEYAPAIEVEDARETKAVVAAAPTDEEGRRLFRHPLTGELVPLRELISAARGRDEATTASQTTEEKIMVMAARVRAVLDEAGAFTADQWNALAVRDRTVVLGATTGAFALGLLGGLLLPKRSSALVTALLGSAIWLIAATWLIQGVAALEPARPLVAGRSATVWAIVWAVAAVIGLAAQIGGLARGRSSGKGDDDED